MHYLARLLTLPALFALSAWVEVTIVDDDGVAQGGGGAPGCDLTGGAGRGGGRHPPALRRAPIAR